MSIYAQLHPRYSKQQTNHSYNPRRCSSRIPLHDPTCPRSQHATSYCNNRANLSQFDCQWRIGGAWRNRHVGDCGWRALGAKKSPLAARLSLGQIRAKGGVLSETSCRKRSSCRIGRAFVSSLPCTYKLAKSLATPIPNQRADDYGDGMNMHTTSALFSCDARLRDARQQSTFPPVSQILQSCGKLELPEHERSRRYD